MLNSLSSLPCLTTGPSFGAAVGDRHAAERGLGSFSVAEAHPNERACRPGGLSRRIAHSSVQTQALRRFGVSDSRSWSQALRRFSTRLLWLPLFFFHCSSALGADLTLDQLQRLLDEKRSQKPTVATPIGAATLIVRSDASCQLYIDGSPVAELSAGDTKSFRAAVGETLVECQSKAEPEVKYSIVHKLEAGTKVVMLIEIQEKIVASRRKRESAAEHASVPPKSDVTQPLQPPTPASTSASRGPNSPGTMLHFPPAVSPSSSAPVKPMEASVTQNEWTRARLQLHGVGANSALANGLTNLLDVTSADEIDLLEKFQSLTKRLPYNSAVVVGEKDGFICFGYASNFSSYALPKQRAIDAARISSACGTSPQAPSVVVVNGEYFAVGLIEVADRLGKQAQTSVRREFLNRLRQLMK